VSKAQLNIAWMWDCDNCGEENFERSYSPEIDPEDLAEIAVENGHDPDAMLCAFPFEVKCFNCGTEYDTEISGEAE
jgi:hypothetical protein